MNNYPMHYELSKPYGTCAAITHEQAAILFTPDELKVGQKRGEIQSYGGGWQITKSYTAYAVDTKTQTIYGLRTLQDVQSLGYELEGRVKAGGRRVRGFTSSLLFELPDGTLIDCAIIYLCMDQPK